MKEIHIDTHTYKELFNDAVKEWKQRTGEEEIYASDISYTLLELQSMLVDMLNYYSEQPLAAHQKKYEKLEQHTEEHKQFTLIPFQMDIKKEVLLRKGTPFPVHMDKETMVLESAHTYHLIPNEICSIFYHDDIHTENITDLLRTLEGTYTLPDDAAASDIFIRVKEAFPTHTPLSFYICVENGERIANGNTLAMADISIEYYSIHGWQKVFDEHDDTQTLCRNGELSFQLGKAMKKTLCFEEDGYWLRLHLEQMFYDHSIGLQAIWMNVITLYACHTLAKSWEIDLMSTSLKIDEDIAKEAVQLQVQQEDGDWYRYPYHTLEEIDGSRFYWEAFPKNSKAARLCAQRQELWDKVSDFNITGIPSQAIAIAPRCTYALALQSEHEVWRDITIVDTYESGNGMLGCYRDEAGIYMGNGRDFELPKAIENGLFFTEFVQKQKEQVLQKESVQVFLPEASGVNALCGALYVDMPKDIGLYYHKQDIHDFLLQNSPLKLKALRIQTCKGLWKIYVMDMCNRACHKAEYRDYIHTLVKKHVPLFDEVEIQDMKEQSVTIKLMIMKQLSQGVKDEIKKSLREYIHTLSVKEETITAKAIQIFLTKQYAITISNCTLYCERQCVQLPFQYEILYIVKDVQFDIFL